MAALGPFERRPRLAVAVSGGSDSLALTLLAAGWARERGGLALGLTVDHGLRPKSAAEASLVAGWLEARGIPARILRWEGAKPATGVQAAARAARYALLEAACREEGILHLLLAHHAQDLAETALIRAERGSGDHGLAAMPAIRERPGLRLLRPLLGANPASLKATLRALGQPWLDDPGNRSPAFRRGRLRAEADLDVPAWSARAAVAATCRRADEERLAAFAAEAVSPHPLGYLDLALQPWRDLPADLRDLVLARSILAVAGAPYPVATVAVARLAASLAVAGHDEHLRATLGGVVLARRGGRLLVIREAARIRDVLPLGPGEAASWDGRYRVRRRGGPAEPMIVRPLDAGRLALPPAVRRGLRDRRVPAAAVEALPSLWRGDRLVACPVWAGGDTDAYQGVDFRPSPLLPLAPASFCGVNVV